MPETIEPTTGLLQEIKNMLLSVMGTQRRTMPYYGPELDLYLHTVDNRGYFPMADYTGKITLDRLKEVHEEVKLDDFFVQPTDKLGLYRKILGAYHSLQFNDDSFEKTVEESIQAAPQPQAEFPTEAAAATLSEQHTIYELASTTDGAITDDAGLLQRTILRTGRWKISPQDKNTELVVDKTMLDNILSAFDEGAFEYVTVPETHQDLPTQNRGFIKRLAVQDDAERPGEYVLRAAFHFTNEDAAKAVREGSIAGVSCGILFDHERKSDGKKFTHALHHVALTNKPWIDGLGKWDKIVASEFGAGDILLVQQETTDENIEETRMSETTPTYTEEQIQAIIAERDRLKLSEQRSTVADVLRPFQAKNINPAVLTSAEKILLAAQSTPKMMTLGENNSQVEFDLSEAVMAMLNAMPEGVDLSVPKTEDGQVITPEQKKPDADVQKTPAEKSAEIRASLGLSEVTADDLKKLGE